MIGFNEVSKNIKNTIGTLGDKLQEVFVAHSESGNIKAAHSSSDKLQEVSKRNLLLVDTSQKYQNLSYVSPTVTEYNSGIGDGTSEKCHRHPHTPRPGT